MSNGSRVKVVNEKINKGQEEEKKRPSNFIQDIIDQDKQSGKHQGRVHTRFPPEPNGYLHIGHAKSICLNFGLAANNNGLCNLRFDDTNPLKEEEEYIKAIKKDVKWLGFDWQDREYYASDYFPTLYQYAIKLIKKGLAYVDHLSADEIREYRGTPTEHGKESPYRQRSVEENLQLFEQMKNGQLPNGACVLRAKIDMAAANLNMRDPVMYRILHSEHPRTGKEWVIYPTYDFTHGQSDSIEGITHSVCTLEFEDHRPLYDWFVEKLEIFAPRQIEFARLNLTYTTVSKRKLLKLVEEGIVKSWDDPRMPTLSGLRRRGYSPEAIRDFCERIGVAKANSTVDIALLEHCLRQDLNKRAKRVLGVLKPLKVVIENYPEGKVEELEAVNNPEDPSQGSRKIPFSREIYIEEDDFKEEPPKKYFRLSPGKEVRLRYAYFITCQKVIKNEKTGAIKELRCTYDPQSRGGNSPDGRKVKGTMHWVCAEQAVPARVNLYQHLFNREDPQQLQEGEEAGDNLNPQSLTVLDNCYLEPSLKSAKVGEYYQFERQGYFCLDPDATKEQLVFNRTVTLRDSWGKIAAKQK